MNAETFPSRAWTPLVSSLCCTYGRPHLLPHAVESFLRQDYPCRELVILDDAGQYAEAIAGDRWRIISVSTRFPTLGEKRNALARLASPEAEVFAVWDDDDVYLPWHLSAAVRATKRRRRDPFPVRREDRT
jgi:glycosyltransferase involved in cell wall biosynthesis